MKTFLSIFAAFLLLAGVAFAASIDGKWVSERTMGERTIIQTFELKADGATLTGKITTKMGDMEPRETPIKDGKVDGNKFSFSVTMPGRDGGEMKTAYEGTVEGDALKGTATREGGQARPFEAKKK